MKKLLLFVFLTILFAEEKTFAKEYAYQVSDNDTKITSPLTFKFIKKCLNDCISDPSDVEKIMDYIKEKRDFRYIKDIKRQYSKNT